MRPPDPPLADTSLVAAVPPAVAEAIDALARRRPGPEPPPAESALFDGSLFIDGSEGAPRAADAAEREARDALRRAVERYARDLRREGVPPERMIVAVKGVVRRAALAPDPLPDPECLIPDLVQWSVAAYFAAE